MYISAMYKLVIRRNILVYSRCIWKQNLSKKYTEYNINLTENTLTGRLLRHVNQKSNSHFAAAVKSVSEFEDAFLDTNLLTDDEKYRRIEILDDQCCNQIDNLSTEVIFLLLHYYMRVVPNKILNYKFYNLSMNRLNNCLEFLAPTEIIQFIFYIGLQKNRKEPKKVLKKCLRILSDEQVLNKLSIEDICVICNSTFKTSTTIKDVKILNKIKLILCDNLFLLKDPALFITLIKSLRHNRYQDDDLLSTISCTILFNSTSNCYSFAAMCHILAAYADYLYYDETILKLFAEKCLEKLRGYELKPKNCYITENIRTKDIKRFLWTFSLLGYQFPKDTFTNVIIPVIKKYMDNGDYKDDPDVLLDSIFYMWIMNYQAEELVPYCLNYRNVDKIKGMKSKTKQRLNILLTCMQIENLPLYKTLHMNPESHYNFDVNLQLQHRPTLNRVFHALKQIAHKLKISKFELDYQIPHLNILGITGYKNNIYKTVFIEVLDDFVCMKNNTEQIYGPMQLKLRLMDKMEQGIVTVSKEEANGMNDLGLYQHLESEINLVS